MEAVSLIKKYWPNEVNIIGDQYLGLLVSQAQRGNTDPDALMVRTNGDHAYGIAETIRDIIPIASLIVSCLQYREALKAGSNVKNEMMTFLDGKIDEERAVLIAEDLSSESADE